MSEYEEAKALAEKQYCADYLAGNPCEACAMQAALIQAADKELETIAVECLKEIEQLQAQVKALEVALMQIETYREAGKSGVCQKLAREALKDKTND